MKSKLERNISRLITNPNAVRLINLSKNLKKLNAFQRTGKAWGLGWNQNLKETLVDSLPIQMR